jgi:hypothetical protein
MVRGVRHRRRPHSVEVMSGARRVAQSRDEYVKAWRQHIAELALALFPLGYPKASQGLAAWLDAQHAALEKSATLQFGPPANDLTE